MTGIIVTFVAAILGLCLLFVFSLRAGQTSTREVTFKEVQASVPGLTASLFPDIEVLFGKDDYRKLRGTPELRPLGGRFRQDRRRIVLMWLSELEDDVRLLWEFRRFLVRNGLSVTLREEATVASAAGIALIYLRLSRAAVFLFGPFALPGALKNARSLVQRLSSREVILLARVPAPRKAEIEQKWAQHLLSLRTG